MQTVLFKALTFAHAPRSLSLLSDIFDYIKETFFTIEYGDYEHIQISSGQLGPIQTVIIGLAIGIIIAACSMTFTQRVIGEFVRELIRRECFDPKGALTLSELGYEKNPSVRGALRSNYVLKKYVRTLTAEERAGNFEVCEASEGISELAENVENAENSENAENKANAENSENAEQKPKKAGVLLRDAGKIDLSSSRFFIDKDESYAADVRFDKKGTNPVVLVIVIIVTIALTIAVFKVLPDLLQMLDNLLGSSDASDNGIIIK